MKSKKWFICILVVTMLVIVSFASGCSGGGDTNTNSDTPSSSDSTETLKIGVNDSLTGAGAVYGLPQQNTMRLYFKLLNDAGGIEVGGKKYNVELIEYDNKSDPTEAVSATRKLIDKDGVNIILGWASSGATKAVSPMLNEEYPDVMMLVGTAGEESITSDGFKNVFRIRPPGGYTGDAAGRFVANDGSKKLAVIAQLKDALYEQYVGHFEEQYKGAGGEVLTKEVFASGDRDMYSQISSALAKKPDSLFVAGYVEQAAFVYRQLRENGWTGKIYGFTGGSVAQFLEVATAEQMEEVYDLRPVEGTIEALGPNAKAYYDAYVAEYKEDPTPNAIYAWDSCVAIVEAIKAAGTVDDTQAIMDALRNLAVPDTAALQYVPVDGKWFDVNGQTYTSNIAVVFKDGDWEYLEDLPSDATVYSKYMTEVAESGGASQ